VLRAGTLTPIVNNPDAAFISQAVGAGRGRRGFGRMGEPHRARAISPLALPSQMREVVRNVAMQFPTAIISGRGREKVRSAQCGRAGQRAHAPHHER
jgi:hypothetical protein